jgi:hypothetical protein
MKRALTSRFHLGRLPQIVETVERARTLPRPASNCIAGNVSGSHTTSLTGSQLSAKPLPDPLVL